MTLNETDRAAVRGAIKKLNQVPAQASYSWAVSEARDLLRSLDGVKTRTTSHNVVPDDDSLTKLLADMEEKARIAPHGLSAEYASRLRVLLDDCATEPENPDVITGDEFADLPEGSIGIICNSDSTPNSKYHPVRPTSALTGGGWRYRVLYRAPEAPVNVGDEITGTRADKLPKDSVVQRREGAYPLIKAVTGWRMGPGDGPFASLASEYGASTTFRVLSIGGK